VTRVRVPAKVNLALVVGERRADGLHEVATVLQRIDVCDDLELREAPGLTVEGFAADTLVRSALGRLAAEVGREPSWLVRLEKRIPVAAGLGGGSADAATALALANETLPRPLGRERLAELAASIGADVPFFLEPGPKLAEGGGETLTPLDLPQDYWILIALPRAARKDSTAEVYRRYDELGGGPGFNHRRAALLDAIAGCRSPRDLAAFPPNDLARAIPRSSLLDGLRAAGALRADMSGAGPALYALFLERCPAEGAAGEIAGEAQTWVTRPVW
jgi:4-diphosphocytidyl-2-C-methyl-D-erythritol kinase